MTKPTILQRHRDAAAAHIESLEGGVAFAIRAGACGEHPLVQAFAAFEARLIARLGEPDEKIIRTARSAYNAGMVEELSETNPRGYVTYYKPEKAWAIALAAVADALKKGE